LEQARLGVPQGSGIDPADIFTDALFTADAAGQLYELFAKLKARQQSCAAGASPVPH
jgi:hypothetical protein